MRLVHRNIEVSWSHTSLSCWLRDQEEVIAFIWFVVLNKNRINNCTWLWILHIISFLNEDSLVYSFIHNYQCYFWNICRIEETFKYFFKLRDFITDNLVSHSFTYSISIDDNFIRRLPFNTFKLSQSFYKASVQVFLYNFLIFSLNYDIWVEWGTIFISGSRESYDWVFTLMTDINSNNHNILFSHKFRQLYSDWFTSNFWIYLLHNIWSNRHIKFPNCSFQDALRKNIHACEYIFKMLIFIFIIYNNDSKHIFIFFIVKLFLFKAVHTAFKSLLELLIIVSTIRNALFF